MEGGALREEELDDEESGAGALGLAAVGEDGVALLRVPVVDNLRKNVGVAAGEHDFEEVAVFDADPVLYAMVAEEGGGFCLDVGSIKEHALCRQRKWLSLLPVAPPTSTMTPREE